MFAEQTDVFKLACNDDLCGVNDSQINFDAEAGVTYLIRVSGWMWEVGDFTLTLLRTALIPKGAQNPDLGSAFLNFLLSAQGRRIIGERTSLPPLDEEALAAQPHLRPIRLDPGLLVYVDPLKRRKFLNELDAALIRP